MVKRLIAFLFILTMAGQVYASVCGCVGGDNEPRHSCCKRQKADRDSISGSHGCCDTDCATQRSERPVQDRTEPASTKIKFEAAKEPVAMQKMAFVRTVAFNPVQTPPFANHRLKYSRTPELYLRHRAFLI